MFSAMDPFPLPQIGSYSCCLSPSLTMASWLHFSTLVLIPASSSGSCCSQHPQCHIYLPHHSYILRFIFSWNSKLITKGPPYPITLQPKCILFLLEKKGIVKAVSEKYNICSTLWHGTIWFIGKGCKIDMAWGKSQVRGWDYQFSEERTLSLCSNSPLLLAEWDVLGHLVFIRLAIDQETDKINQRVHISLLGTPLLSCSFPRP